MALDPPKIRPLDVSAFCKRGLKLIVLDPVTNTLELRFADHVEIWRRLEPGTATRIGRALTFNGDVFVGARAEPE